MPRISKARSAMRFTGWLLEMGQFLWLVFFSVKIILI
jgi:hypothetical protein